MKLPPKWLALTGAGCLIFVLFLLAAKRETGTPDLHIANQAQMTNGAMFINVVLSNGTSKT